MSNVTSLSIATDMAKLQALLETGDEITPEAIADTMEGLAMELGDKMDAIMNHVRNLEGQANTCGEEAARLSARKRSFENKADNLKAYILSCLLASGQKSLKTARNTLTVRKGTAAVVIDDVNALPDEMVEVKTTVSPDKRAIKAAIEAGEDITGAHIETSPESLQVR